MIPIILISAVVALAVSSSVRALPSNPDLVAQLKTASTLVDRLKLLEDSDLLFNFLEPPSTRISPPSIGNGIAMTIGFLGPCGMNTPHTHPRATEINFSINTTLRAGLLVENGARFIDIEIAPGSATVFPQGAIHFEMNPSCEPAMFVAGFNHEDPGSSKSHSAVNFGLPPNIVGATLGGLGVVEVADLESKIPDNIAFGAEECLARCGITRTNQPTLQRQPRVSGNAFPEGAAPSPTVTVTETVTAAMEYTTVYAPSPSQSHY
ncbi:RmlC-like cupin [Auriscalpium vulgare]|uniref:RmlC-like cupin n=1 Tax=Auriscalpium vulgare TaxID=40419 RepID=A0ACB8RI90_9AGAM|nr:RmlC-like cupin [Auriscalpium vulgare]